MPARLGTSLRLDSGPIRDVGSIRPLNRPDLVERFLT